MIDSNNFDDIRPYNPEELPGVFDELEKDEQFRGIVAKVMPGIPFEAVMAKARTCKNLLDFQKTFSYGLMQHLMDNYTDGTDMDAGNLDRNKNYTFISNHRDIVLDSAFLSILLLKNGFTNTAEIAIGDNLLAYPWIQKIVRLNKSFTVKRSLQGRQRLFGSLQLSNYMHYAINKKHENIWIAQRQGRAKDSDDRTQVSLLKMMALGGGEGTYKQKLRNLHIVPLCISYEYDPCDFLKAKEFQQKHDDPNFQKSKADDVISMQTGIMGYKGKVHYQASACIDEWIDAQPDDLVKLDFCEKAAEHIDQEIHCNYRLFANNYVAYDELLDTDRFCQLYTNEERKRFDDYLQKQIAKVDLPNPNHEFLKKMILTMYANPLINYLKAAEK